MGISEQQFEVISKYWGKKGGPNFFDELPFRMFNITNDRSTILNLAKRYYGGEEKWKDIINQFIGKRFNLKTTNYDIDYIITDIDFSDEWEDIERVEVKIDPNGKVDIDGNLTLTIEEMSKIKDGYDFLDKYYPEIEKGSAEYDQNGYELGLDFFTEDSGFVEALEDYILSELSSIITRPYGANIDFVTILPGVEDDFNRQLKMFEQFDRIKTLISFSYK
jgi:hypothetical protein